MKALDRIAEIMTTDVVTVDVDSSLKEVKETFAKRKIRHMPVVSKDNLVGILSLTDIQRMSFGNTFGLEESDTDAVVFDMLSINQVMKHSPETVHPEDSVDEVAALLANKEFHALPVVQNGELVGIVTTTDLIKYFVEKRKEFAL